MATIKSQMALNDGMSAVLKKITSALDTTLASFEQIQRASGNAMDVAEIEAARGALADASNAVDEMAENYRRAAQEEERLNQNIHEGTSALDGMVTKVISLVGAYMSLSAIKGFATSSMDAANVQINAQRQLRTVLNNMGAEDDFNALVDETSGNTLENTLALDTTEAAGNYTAFTAGVDGGRVSMEVQADTGQATAAYDAILAKASEIQGAGIYGDEAMIAGAAEFATYFSDANAILSMMDTLTDYAMGMSGGGALDTEAMVDYATGLGKIMSGSYDAMTKKGFEFTDTQKAIIEGTATEAQIVAELGEEYLGMSQDMQAAAAINAVIAESWGGLYEAMSNTPEGKIIQLNNALGDIKENVGAGIYPAVLNFINVFQQNLPQIEAAAMGLATMLGFVISLLTGMVEGAIAFGTAVADNWSWIGPIVYGIIAALGAYVSYLGVMKTMELASAAGKVILIAAEYAHAAATGAAVAATTAETAAQMGLNTALLACPITWIIIAIIALIAAIVAVVRALDIWGASTHSVLGTITGLFSVAVAFIGNILVGLVNFGIDVFAVLWNFIAAFANFFGSVFNDPIGAIARLFFGLVDTILSLLQALANVIDTLFGSNLAGAVQGWRDSLSGWVDDTFGHGEEFMPVINSEEYHLDRFVYGDAFEAGADFGDGLSDQVSGLFEPGDIEDYTDDGMGNNFMMDSMGNDVGEIADNTGGMAHALEVSGEELKYLRDVAERDAINRFTTAEVKIDMTGMTNKIDSGADLDGVIRELTDGFSEALVTAAEGVHE